jgi:Holliday junction resolvase RusA-like endonuclease
MRGPTLYVIDPQPKVKQTRADIWKRRPSVVKYRAFADRARELGITLEDGDSVCFVVAMPASWSSKRRAAMLGEPHRQTPDLDNLLGGLMDAVMPKGDAHLAELGHLRKLWGTQGQIVVSPKH